MMLSTNNSKLAKAGEKHNAIVASFTLPAGPTCPFAGACAVGCYAKTGAFTWKAPRAKHQANLECTKDEFFVAAMTSEVLTLANKARRNGKRLFVRIHDAGDFYSAEYLAKWVQVAANVELAEVDVTFYAYTKSLDFVRDAIGNDAFGPSNMTFVFSTGGKLDHTIHMETERHTRVFSTEEELLAAGYVNASADDLVAADRAILKVGLVFHGSKAQAKAWGVTHQGRKANTQE